MKRVLFICAAVAATTVLSACDTTTPMASYSVLPSNTLALQSALKAKGTTVQVGQVTKAASVEEPHCRMVGALDVTNGKSMEEYFKSAVQAELLAAQSYDVSSATSINLRIDQVAVATMGDGNWTIGLTFTSNANPTGYQVTSTHKFKTSFTAYAACQNATASFIPAVQDAIGAGVNDARFATLLAK